MKKQFLLMVMALLVGVGAQAKVERTYFKLTDSNFSLTLWGSDNAVDTSTGKITYGSGEGQAVGWTLDPAMDFTQYDRLVVKIKPNSLTCSETYDWWNGVTLFLDVDGKSDIEVYQEKFNLADNNAEDYFTRTIDLKQTYQSGENHDNGTTVSLDAISKLRFRAEKARISFEIDEIYLEKNVTTYDEIVTTPAYIKNLELKLTDDIFNYKYTGDNNSVNTETGELTLGINSTAAWDRYYNSEKFNLLNSDIFVVKLQEAATQDLIVIINQKGFWETVGDAGTGHMETLKKGETELIINLSDLAYNSKDGITDKMDLSDIYMINLWSGVADACTYKIDEIYAASNSVAETYLVRDIPTANKYGTICLPYASEIPANTTVYEVTAVDSKDNPKELYITEVQEMKAGYPYIFKTTEAGDLTFTKKDNDENLVSAYSSNGLVGSFEQASAEEGKYILANGTQWKKVAEGQQKTVKAYRAYLDLTSVPLKNEVSQPVLGAARRMSIVVGDGDTTGIDGVEIEGEEGVKYNLNGVRVSGKGNKNIVVKNGKKVINK